MFHRYLMLALVLCVFTGCQKESLTEDQKKVREELIDLGIKIHGTDVLDIDLKGSDKITPDLLKKIVSFGKISYLNLSDSNVTDECLEALQDAEAVETIFLTGTEITDKGLEHLAHLDGLIILHLPPTITDAGFESIGEITSLRTLVADDCKITDAGMASLENLSELRWLKINYTNVGDKGLDSIKDLTNLHTLEISNTKITDRGLLVLSGLSKLNVIELSGCDVSEEAVEALRKELPETEILSGVTLEAGGSGGGF